MLKTYFIYTYGCSMNYSDTERITTYLDSCWLSEVWNDKEADLVIFNTCSIKQKAEDKVFGTFKILEKIKKKYPERRYWITGCMVKKTWIRDKESQYYSNDPLLYRTNLIDFVFRILDTGKLCDILDLYWKNEKVKILNTKNSSDNLKLNTDSFFSISQKLKSPFQALVPIQTWCDNFCTYCVVPNTRWREYSRPMDEILREIKSYAKKWIKEIILVGQNVNSYGKWWIWIKRKWDTDNLKWLEWREKTPFSILLEEVCKIDWIERIRFLSSNPHDMTDDIISTIISLPKIMPCFHLALQSWNNSILKRMNRRHTYEEYKILVDKIRNWNPNASITTDLIVWFCWETEEEFQDTVKAVREIKFDMIYQSQYSARKGTYAWDKLKDNISKELKLSRWHTINNILIESLNDRFKKLEWKVFRVMIERVCDSYFDWKTEEWFSCRIRIAKWDNPALIGSIISVKIIWNSKWALEWECV